MRRAARLFGLAAVPGLLAACSGTPEGVDEQDIANYMTAAATIGCVMKYESDYLPVELQAGLTRQQVIDITTYMTSTDRAVKLPDGGVQLTTGACA